MLLKPYYLLIFISIFSIQKIDCQDITIGTLFSDENAYDGLTLFAPFSSFDTYLIDNCGEYYKKWESDSRLAASVYLAEDGSLYRTARQPGNFAAGGIGGKIEQYSWEGELIWEFIYADEDNHMHHDIEILPNGNILAIAWERKTSEEAALKGKNGPGLPEGLWPDQIIEIQKTGPQEGEIVWSWHVWDHLIQNTSPQLEDFGIPEDHPERININFQSVESDWIHLNGIDYNAELDQIIVSSRHLSEIWVIDHSTTTEEAASSTGGRYGKGGDLLYRWGNPMAYGRGSNLDQILFGPHDIRWIEEDLPEANKLSIFNNGEDRSSVSIINSDVNPDGSYNLNFDEPYLPATPDWTFDGGDEYFFYSRSISGTQILPNGNMLITDGEAGNLLEIDREGNPHWIYEIPVNSITLSQGDFPSLNQIFKAQKYAKTFPGFDGKVLESQGPVELDPIDTGCTIISSIDNTEFSRTPVELVQFPMEGIYKIISNDQIDNIMVFNQVGQMVYSVLNTSERNFELDLGHLNSGVYFAQLKSKSSAQTVTLLKF